MMRSASVLLCLAFAIPAAAQVTGESSEVPRTEAPRRIHGDRVTIGDRIVVPAGTIRDGNIVCIMGEAVIDGEVRGAVTVIGGLATVSGTVGRDLVTVLSNVRLESSARIGGELVNLLGRMSDEGAEVRRGYVDVPMILPLSESERPLAVLGALLLWLRSMAVVVFLVLVLVLTALTPRRVLSVSEAASRRYLLALLVGVAVHLALPVVIALLITTVIGIPLVPFALVGFVLLTWLGRAGVLHLVGERIGRVLGFELSLLGAVMVGMVPYGLVLLVPLISGGPAGLIAHFLLSGALFLLLDVPAVGLVLLTRGGSSRTV